METLPEILATHNGYGLPAVHDVAMIPGTDAAVYAAVGELEKQGKLSMPISAFVMAQRPLHLEGPSRP